MYYGRIPDELQVFHPHHQRVLSDLTISETHPGPLLHDMSVLLELLIAESFELSANHRLSLKMLHGINERLHIPITLALKRPQQKSYPPIVGLYLLLRASGLTRVDESGKKPVLLLAEDVYEQWKQMNFTERYGSLLEAWLLRGDRDIIGERSFGTGIPDNFYRSAEFYSEIPNDGLPIAGNRDTEQRLRYHPEIHNLGLLREFGLIHIEDGPPQPEKGWNIQRIHRTAIGDALFVALFNGFFSDFERIFDLEFDGGVQNGMLRDVLSPYFTDWEKILVFPEAIFQEGVYTFKVMLGSVWRRIEIGAEQTLDNFANAILNSVSFDRDHLYKFTYRDRFGSLQHAVHPYMEESPATTEVQIGSLPLTEGGTMTFLFDFGDNWEFDIVLEAIRPGDSTSNARMVEAQGEAPEQYPDWDDE
jgi:hypothetical protein